MLPDYAALHPSYRALLNYAEPVLSEVEGLHPSYCLLTRISMIGNDMMLDPGVGTCGKEGQSVPVGVGLPTVRIDGLTVGGTA